MAITVVQTSARAVYGGAGTTANVSLTSVVLGNLIVVLHVCRAAPDGGTHTVSVSDGTAYTQAAQIAFNDSGSNWSVAAAHYLPSASSGSHSITGTLNAGAFNCYGFFIAMEIGGCATSTPADISVTASGSTATPGSGSTGVLAQANEIVFAVLAAQNAGNLTFTLPSGFTNVTKEETSATYNTIMGSIDYQIVASTSALSPAWGTITTSPTAALAVSFKQAAAASTGGMPTSRLYRYLPLYQL